ncbi:MAG: 2Fe-2S iron-sulfur cluster binding domain-containing protein [Xanthobacteraceae bacterium]|nr:2Fe-2S iron-sulfur cluster binding domain-containing protein [Xanthobacteraceae bacterium]MBX3533431.1 2Fe-2S iron-sulfur cluster binding domain-containing protein [Xanthobacteraceae bacterium]MCW5676371.1 2Fe-2S iron-sulfur cluster binding domain-containing protein [Xanthobacteraceae bacterium]
MKKKISITINGKSVASEIEPRTTLADFLRDSQRLTGTKLGCEHGVCGACTVLINGTPGRSCITFAATLEGAEVQTIEGFEKDPVMEAVRHAFHTEHGLQCGFCTAGMLITARDIVRRFPSADEKTIRNELSGNLCRCTGYMGIVKAVQKVLHEVPAEDRVRNPVANKAAIQPFAFKPFKPKADSSANANSRPAFAKSAGESESANGWTRITDSFTVARSRAETWSLFSDFARMASCMPGAVLEKSDGKNLEGQVRVAFGPIRAGFRGKATVERNDEIYKGLIVGGGSDVASGSRAKGQVTYQLQSTDNDSKTIVNLTLEFQLQGALAQFSRAGLIKDFASRLIGAFAKNLADELEGRRNTRNESAELRVSSLVWSVLVSRMKTLWAKLTGAPTNDRGGS